MDKIIREEARLIILRTLAKEPAGRMNSALLQSALDTFGIPRPRDWVHEEMGYLESMGAVTVINAGSVRVATITLKGLDHVGRRVVIEGVKRPGPEA